MIRNKSNIFIRAVAEHLRQLPGHHHPDHQRRAVLRRHHRPRRHRILLRPDGLRQHLQAAQEAGVSLQVADLLPLRRDTQRHQHHQVLEPPSLTWFS